ncbi:hypothetical protein Tco_0771394 [Tanacetum coccineum]|uniref:Uncharacterized protein n=1 Tax=Tanacetum coccineum TaxID=301880 RepID=A0ABQ4ZIP6_9ASTR
MLKSTKPHPCFFNNDYTYLVDLSTKEKYTTSITKHYTARYYKDGIEDMIPKRCSKEVRRYHFEALNGIYHWEENRIDFFKAGMSAITEGNVFSDLRIKSIVRIDIKKKWGYGFLTSIVVRRSDDKEYEFSYADLLRLSVNDVEYMYLLQVQDKLHHLLLEFVKDFNNALLMFIRRTVIKNRVEDIQLGLESYQRTLNLTKPTMFFEGINQRTPFTMTTMHKGENLIDMVSKNNLGSSNKMLKGRDWTDYDVKSSREMQKKIDEILRHREQLMRLEEDNVGLDLVSCCLRPSSIERGTTEGVGLRVANSHTGNHYGDDFTPLETIRRRRLFEVAFLECVKLVIISSNGDPIQMFVAMPFDNLKLCDSDDSTSRIYITSRFPIDSKSIELFTFASPMVMLIELLCGCLVDFFKEIFKLDQTLASAVHKLEC